MRSTAAHSLLLASGPREQLSIKKRQSGRPRHAGVHLSEHGGTGDGIIGALAGTGLRMQGNDGRLLGWLDLGTNSEIITVRQLLDIPSIDRVNSPDGHPLTDDTEIFVAEQRVKTVLNNHLRVVPTVYTAESAYPELRTLTKKEVKQF